jgi:hypothetical protein
MNGAVVYGPSPKDLAYAKLELVLPGDDRVVPASVALDEAIAIFWIDIAAEFPVALRGSKCPNHFPEARNCENRESTFDWANDRSACNSAILFKDTSDGMRLDSDKSCQSRQAMCNNES